MGVLRVAILFVVGCALVDGHGRLINPIGRSSMWRYGFRTPANYDDTGMNCGGRWAQHGQNGGRCGPCGDNFSSPRPRDNENTGKYGRGIPTKTYNSGEVIAVTVEVTANHMGWFEFSLCPLSAKNALETEECFDRYPLMLADGTGRRVDLKDGRAGKYNLKLKLPQGVKCQLCVMRWHYHTGNSWGVCPDGSGAMGCGDQETFRNCADIAIV